MKHIRYLILLLFIFIYTNGYTQLNQFLIGNSWDSFSDDYSKRNTADSGMPLDFSNDSLKHNFFQRMIGYGINTLAGGNFPDTKIESALSLGLKVLPNRSGSNFPDSLHPNIIGYYLGDEPEFDSIPNLIPIANEIRTKNSNLLRWVNLYHSHHFDNYPQYCGYIQKYIDMVKPNILSFDAYPVWTSQDLYHGGEFSVFFETLYGMGSKSVENSIPFFYLLTPIRATTSDGVWDTTQTETIQEFRYCIYSALIYGAKGIVYWPGFEWMLTCNEKTDKIVYSIKTPFTIPTIDSLKSIHSKLASSSNVLLKLNFASVYHYTTNTNIVKTIIHRIDYPNEVLPSFEYWHGMGKNTTSAGRPGFGIEKDMYAKFIFSDPKNPITLIKTDSVLEKNKMEDFAVSFMTDSIHGIYFWIMNKGLSYAHNFTLNFKATNVSSYTDLLNTPYSIRNLNSAIHLEPGEAKLFKVNKCNINDSVSVNIYNTIYAYNNPSSDYNYSPLVTADLINIGGDNGGVIFESGTNSSFMGHKIVLGKGVTIKSGSNVVFKKYTESNIINPNQSQSLNGNILNMKAHNKEILALNSEIKIFPNPTKGEIFITQNLPEIAEISVFNNMGKLVKIVNTNSKESTISLTKESPGIYFLRIKAKNKNYNYKIIKQ